MATDIQTDRFAISISRVHINYTVVKKFDADTVHLPSPILAVLCVGLC